jgi:hypothetical protein
VTSALLICVAAAAALLGNIKLRGELHRLDLEIGQLDRALAKQRKSNEKLQADYEVLTSSAELARRVEEMRLDLRMPGADSRVVLPEPILPSPSEVAGAGREGHVTGG